MKTMRMCEMYSTQYKMVNNDSKYELLVLKEFRE